MVRSFSTEAGARGVSCSSRTAAGRRRCRMTHAPEAPPAERTSADSLAALAWGPAADARSASAAATQRERHEQQQHAEEPLWIAATAACVRLLVPSRSQHVGDVGPGGPLGDPEPCGDLAVVQPLDDQAQYLPLARSEVVARPGKDARLVVPIRRKGPAEGQHQLGERRVLLEHLARAQLRRGEAVVGGGVVAQHDHGRCRAPLSPAARWAAATPAAPAARRAAGVPEARRRVREIRTFAPRSREQGSERAHVELVAAANEQAEASEVVAQEILRKVTACANPARPQRPRAQTMLISPGRSGHVF